jgi:hypothetical protein
LRSPDSSVTEITSNNKQAGLDEHPTRLMLLACYSGVNFTPARPQAVFENN